MHLCCRKQPSQEQQHTSRHSCRTCSIPTQSPSLPTALQHASRGIQIIHQPGTSSCHWQQKAYPNVQSCYDCNFYLYNLIICGIFYLSCLFIFYLCYYCLLYCPLLGPNDTYLWTTDASQANMKSSDALTVDATSYALLAAVQLGKNEMADKIASWLTTQENYGGGFRSSQVVWMLC